MVRPVPRRLLPIGALTGVAVIALALRLELLSSRSLWIDEALSLDIAARGPAEIVSLSRAAEPHPPGYYLLLWGWQLLFGDTVATARTLSLLFGLAAVLLTWAMGRRLFGQAIGLSAAGIVALHPFQIFASNEIRMYPLLATLGLAATLSLAGALEKPHRLTLWAIYGLLAAAIAYTSYYGLLLLAGHAAAVCAVVRGRAPWRGPAVGVAVALACYSPWISSFVPSVTSNPVPWRPPFTWAYPLEILISQTFGGHLLDTPAYHASGPPSLLWVALVAPFVVLLLLGARKATRSNHGVLLLCSCLVPIVLVVGVSAALNKVVAYQYHLSYIVPYAACLLALGGASVVERVAADQKRTAALGLAILVLAYMGPAALTVQRGTREVYRFDVAARWLAERRRLGDVTIYFTETGQRVLRRYLVARGPEIAIAPSPRRWTLEESEELLRRAVAPLEARHRRIWLVLTPPFPPGSAEDLIRLLEEKGYRTNDRGMSFGGVFIQLLERQ
jgi:uncharacterized membrane protein